MDWSGDLSLLNPGLLSLGKNISVGLALIELVLQQFLMEKNEGDLPESP